MDSDKAGDSHLLDELLGIDRRLFEDDERTQVLSRSEPPPKDEAEDQTFEEAQLIEEEDAVTLHVPEVAPIAAGFTNNAPAPRAAPIQGSPVHVAAAFTAGENHPEEIPLADAVLEDESADATQPKEPLRAETAAAVLSAVSDMREDDALIGELVDGRYRVLSVLGIGGIGIVFLCRHELLEKPVAMKVLRSEYVLHEDLNERFLNEARAASAIKSPRIVDTLDVGTLPNGAPYFVMEYVDGETLAALLDREGSVPVPLALDVARQIAEGLEAAHEAGVVHRDLKPENVFLAQQPDGELFAKIFDFGIAKVARARKRLTYAGAVFGTPHYMSPEQARGEAVDARSDLYALGVMLFEMVTGAVPFDGEDPLAVMSQHVDRAPPTLASVTGFPVPPGLEVLVARCLAKEPAHRYANATQIVADLSTLEADPDAAESPLQPVEIPAPVLRSPPPPMIPRAETLHAHVVPALPQQARQKRRRLFAIVATSVVAFSASIWGATHFGNAEQREQERVAAAALTAAPDSATRTAPAPAVDKNDPVEVHFVLSPIDARLFRGEEDLGPMPVSITIPRGQTQTLTVRRRGYTTRRVVVDGTETRVVVGMMKTEPPSKAAVSRRKAN